MKKYILHILLFIFLASCNKNELLDEYNILLSDLNNSYTCGYKSHLDPLTNTFCHKINLAQGALILTEQPINFAIMGEGFFKVVTKDRLIAFTRNGEFTLTHDLKFINSSGAILADIPYLPEDFIEIFITNTGCIKYKKRIQK